MPAIERAVAEVNPAIAVRTRVARQSVSNGLVRERLDGCAVRRLRRAGRDCWRPLASTACCRTPSRAAPTRSAFASRWARAAPRCCAWCIVEAGWLVGIGLVIGTGAWSRRRSRRRALLFGLQPSRSRHDRRRGDAAGRDRIGGQLPAGAPRLPRRSDERAATGMSATETRARSRTG